MNATPMSPSLFSHVTIYRIRINVHNVSRYFIIPSFLSVVNCILNSFTKGSCPTNPLLVESYTWYKSLKENFKMS